VHNKPAVSPLHKHIGGRSSTPPTAGTDQAHVDCRSDRSPIETSRRHHSLSGAAGSWRNVLTFRPVSKCYFAMRLAWSKAFCIGDLVKDRSVAAMFVSIIG
jgi:hypothetical protein